MSLLGSRLIQSRSFLERCEWNVVICWISFSVPLSPPITLLTVLSLESWTLTSTPYPNLPPPQTPPPIPGLLFCWSFIIWHHTSWNGTLISDLVACPMVFKLYSPQCLWFTLEGNSSRRDEDGKTIDTKFPVKTKTSETRLTATVLRQHPNTSKIFF